MQQKLCCFRNSGVCRFATVVALPAWPYLPRRLVELARAEGLITPKPNNVSIA
jgi:hypothetical protein